LIPFLLLAALTSAVSLAAPSNPFYAMDTAFAPHFRKNGLSRDEGLDLVKELGFAGVAWIEKNPDDVQSDLAAIEQRGLRMFAIYAPVKITAEGELAWSAQLPAVMDILKGHDVIVWVHIGGQGPDIAGLRGDALVIARLRELAAQAQARGLKVAVYPHLGEWTARFGDATRVAQLVDRPNFGVSFNLCHCLATGDEERIPSLLEAARAVLVTATINGADTGVRLADPQRWKRLIQPLGSGTFPVAGVVRTLQEIGFGGPIGFQGYGIVGEPRAILAPTMAAWRQFSSGSPKP
jgi:sugar phosphate isomerase/epimerase